MFIGRLTLREIQREASRASTFVFEKPQATWLAGQHFMFIKPHFPFDLRGLTRVFTIASAPGQDFLSFTTRYFYDRSSSFKRSLFRMQPGDPLWAFGPSPIFDYFRALDAGKEYVFLVGGIGITPVMATLRHHAAVPGNLKATVIYANRDHEVIFKDELDSLQAGMTSLAINYITSPQHIDAAVIGGAAGKYSAPMFIVSGSRRFVDGMVALMRGGLGVQKNVIIADKFRAIPLSGGGI
jgi:ferredoxin-NADP reductase